MEKPPFTDYPEVFQVSKEMQKAAVSATKAGTLRRIWRQVYTTNLTDPPEQIIQNHQWPVVAMVCPRAVVSHRTALAMKSTPGGTVFVTGPYARTLELPSFRIRQIKGPGPLPGDTQFIDGLSISSLARAYMECLMKPPRGKETAYLPQVEIERRIDDLLRLGEDRVTAIRDRAREIKDALNSVEEFNTIDAIIGGLLGTRSTNLQTPQGRSRAIGKPYDPNRLVLFNLLVNSLAEWSTVLRQNVDTSGNAFSNAAFYDAYFSNYIEGTKFKVEEAEQIVFENKIPESRPEDAHDIISTYKVVGDTGEMSTSVSDLNADEFIDLIRKWHNRILQRRPDKNPGMFKTRVNVTGGTEFVRPEMSEETLRKGFPFVKTLPTAFCRAAYLMFLVAEVHPFDDGNGRTARAIMNAELIAHSQCRIIITTSFRLEYMGALKRLTNHRQTALLPRMLDYAQESTNGIDFSDRSIAQAQYSTIGAFEEEPTRNIGLFEEV